MGIQNILLEIDTKYKKQDSWLSILTNTGTNVFSPNKKMN